jgi:uroporphyrinogen-III synthase
LQEPVVREFEQSLHMMLHGAFLSYARVREITVEDDAASFFVDRALYRTLKRENRYAQYAGAVSAITNLPRFFDRIEQQTQTRSLTTFSVAEKTEQEIQATGFRCVYPWCSDLQTP